MHERKRAYTLKDRYIDPKQKQRKIYSNRVTSERLTFSAQKENFTFIATFVSRQSIISDSKMQKKQKTCFLFYKYDFGVFFFLFFCIKWPFFV